jgi:hypothetical protein
MRRRTAAVTLLGPDLGTLQVSDEGTAVAETAVAL